MVGSDGAAIQRAIDCVAGQGGGTVRVLPGRYVCLDSVRLRSRVRLIGEMDSTFLVHGAIPASPLAMDADIGERQITPASVAGFKVGMGVVLRDRTKPNTLAPMPLTVERIEDGTLFVDDEIIHDWCAEDGGCVVAYAPLIHAFEVEDVVVDGFTLDGSVENPPAELDDLWGGNLYFRRVRGATVRNLNSHDARGDGIRFGRCKDIVVADCEAHNNSNYGVHPGSHTCPVHCSKLHIHHNGSDGLYICWGVRNSVFEHCKIHHNGHRLHRTGLCIGHKDTDNLIANNHIYKNCKHGIHIREKTQPNGAHRNVFRGNRIEDNGTPLSEVPEEIRALVPEDTLTGCGIYVNGLTDGLVFEDNVVRDTRSGEARLQRRGIYIAPNVSGVELKNNTVVNHPDGNVVAGA